MVAHQGKRSSNYEADDKFYNVGFKEKQMRVLKRSSNFVKLLLQTIPKVYIKICRTIKICTFGCYYNIHPTYYFPGSPP